MDSLRGVCAGAGLDCRRLSRGSPRAGLPHEMQVRLERPELDRDLRALVSGIREALSQAVVSTAELWELTLDLPDGVRGKRRS